MVREMREAIAAGGKAIATSIERGRPYQPALAGMDQSISRVMLAGLRRAAIAGAEDVAETVKLPTKAGPQPGYVDAFVLSWIRRHSVRQVARIRKTTARAIRRQIIDGARNGWSNAKIAAAIRKATSGRIGKVRAERIARTETHTAFERGSYEQAKELKRLGLEIEAEWGATEDKRTRPTHAEANGKRVDLGKSFRVGGEAMRFPGDPRASARNVVNCRCVALYYPKGTR